LKSRSTILKDLEKLIEQIETENETPQAIRVMSKSLKESKCQCTVCTNTPDTLGLNLAFPE
jgi:hypothetical protein